MAIIPPPPDQPRVRYPEPRRFPPLGGPLRLLAVVPLLALLVLGYVWFVMRIEVEPGHVLVLMRKVGAELPIEAGDQVVLYPGLFESPDSTRFKGIVYDVLPEGRYFYDPFFWDRKVFKAVVINADEVGVLVRKYGQPLPSDQTVATKPEQRGPLAEVLPKGRHNINPFAYDVERFPVVIIPPGHVGVQRLLHGRPPANPNDWVVAEGERGVQPKPLPPGRCAINPYVTQLDLIDVRSHTLDLREADAIRFPSSDSFEIVVEATVEYAISQEMAPYVMVAIGGHKDIEEKLILPYARSLSRIEGSKLLAREFISGDARLAFQNAFFTGLRDQCAAQGIEIRATPIRRIEPPAAIANLISDRQLAEQQISQYENEIKVAQTQARLVEQEEMRSQNEAVGQANREVVTVVTQAEQSKAVALTAAQQRLEVARLTLAAAREQAAAQLALGQANAEVILLNAQAEAEPLAAAVAAFGSGDAYAQYFFYQQLAPALKSILASTEGPFADIFRTLSTAPPPPTTHGGGQ